MNSGFGVQDGTPVVVHHDHLNLGLAVDVQKSDGSRTLLVPNIKHADELDFAAFFVAYEDLIRKVRTNKLSPDDFAGTTATITNPGMIGTVHSVPRLMPGQGFIIGVGTIGYPAEYEGADPQTVARLGVSKTFTLTSTYDHRIIGGAESGEFLRAMHQLLLGVGRTSTTRSSRASRCPTSRRAGAPTSARWTTRRRCSRRSSTCTSS